MRKLLSDKHGDMNFILGAVLVAIVFAVGIIIIFNVLSSVDMSTIDSNLNSSIGQDPGGGYTPGANATESLLDNVNTFYTVGPIALIVIAAVGILSYILLLRRR